LVSREYTAVGKTADEAAVWQVFDVLCGVLPESASVRWQSVRLKCCKQCVERGVTREELEAAARFLGLQPGRGAGEQALIDQALEARGEKPQTYGRPVFTKPDTVEKIMGASKRFMEMGDARN
jgi:hypothetical protein